MSEAIGVKCSQLILMNIVATKCHILRLNAPNSISERAGQLPQAPSWI